MSNKLYKRVSGAWTEAQHIKIKVGGVWTEVKKKYQNINGTWTVVYFNTTNAIEYTFTSSIADSFTGGILLSNYVDPASGNDFILTIDSGVTITGMDGHDAGISGVYGNDMISIANCSHAAAYGNGGDGPTGDAGYPAIDFTGFSGKTVTIINNGSVSGGRGGPGGEGGIAMGSCYGGEHYSYGGCGGPGGPGGPWASNTTGVTIDYAGTEANFHTGATGDPGYDASSDEDGGPGWCA